MRKIKFRAVEYHDGVVVEVHKDITGIDYDEEFKVHNARLTNGEWLVNIKPLQYTGLKDINGVEIYEGDIVKETVKLERGKKQESFYEINFSNGMFRYKQPLVYGYEYLEVIGNIYENPEMIL